MNYTELIQKSPIFLPDATYGVVKSVDSHDLRTCGIEAVVMNTFHLMTKPGSTIIKSLGGLHQMTNWDEMIITDSGGFQAYSLIHSYPKTGSISDHGLVVHLSGNNKRILLTPEKSIQLQMNYGSDIIYCLDDCTHPDAPFDEQEQAVKRTIKWAIKCKKEYERIISEKKIDHINRPRIFAVIQGGRSFELRKLCSDRLQEIGFDGYGYGGWPIDSKGKLLSELLNFVKKSIQQTLPLHALGIGHPENLVKANILGWHLFDSALPTRDARRGRLYAIRQFQLTRNSLEKMDWFDFVYILDEKHIKSKTSIYPGCECYTCQQYSTGYLHHLCKIDDPLYFRLATIHNLSYMNTVCEILRNDDKTN